MKEIVYHNIVDEQGVPVRKWVTDEEYEKYLDDIHQIKNTFKIFIDGSAKQNNDHFKKHERI